MRRRGFYKGPVGLDGALNIPLSGQGPGPAQPSVAPVVVLRVGFYQHPELLRRQCGASRGEVGESGVVVGVAGVVDGVGVEVAVEGLGPRAVGACEIVHDAAEQVVHRDSGLYQHQEGLIGPGTAGVVLDDLQVAGVGFLVSAHCQEGLGGLVPDAGTVLRNTGAWPGWRRTGPSALVVPLSGPDQREFFPHPDLKGESGAFSIAAW